jgi:hypothetical protein
MSCFCAHQQNAGTVADEVILSEKPCCVSSPQAVTAVRQIPRTLPHCGDDEAFADRLQRAWQKMLDDSLDHFQVQADLDRERIA